MGGRKDKVARAVDEGSFLLCVCSPKDEYQPLAAGGQGADGSIGELFPPLTLVTACLMGTHGEGGIEQEDSLIGPTGKIA